jgi:hypothetical protein
VSTSGYSGTPLAKKLGIKAFSTLCVLNPPADYDELVAPLPEGVKRVARCDATTRLVHLFVTDRAVLARELERLRGTLAPDAVLWVSWPKKSAKVQTDITEDTIREVGLPLGWVDIKVCAVDATWSGLKLMVRTALR